MIALPRGALLVLITLAVVSLAASWPAGAEERPPNMIVVFCDNLGYGDIEPFGAQQHRTPHLNRMAREGRKFTDFYVSSGVCTPSRASIITGCYAQRVGMHFNDRDGHVLRPISPYGLHPNEVTIAESLKQRGYATGVIGKWHLGDQPSFLPTRQGFDFFFGVPYSDDMTDDVGQRIAKSGRYKLDGERWPPLPLMENETVIEAPVDRDLLTKRYTQRAVRFIEDNRDKPFFLYLPHAMPGSTQVAFASPEFKGKSNNGSWGDSIEELDWSTGQILDKLVELGIEKNTLVVWTSDNGAPMRGKTDITRGSNLPLFGRLGKTSEGGFRVPTIMWWPGKVPAGTTCSEVATTMDLLPTFARIAGGREPQDRIIDGRDILPLIVGEPNAKSPHEAFFYYQLDQLQAVRSGPWKLFVPLESFQQHPHFRAGKSSEPLLFNLAKDIGSTNNVASEHPEIVARLNAFADKARKDLGDLNQSGTGRRAIGKVENPVPQVQ